MKRAVDASWLLFIETMGFEEHRKDDVGLTNRAAVAKRIREVGVIMSTSNVRKEGRRKRKEGERATKGNDKIIDNDCYRYGTTIKV